MPPIIVQTSQGSIDAAIGAMRAGAIDFIVKPVSPDDLLKVIRQVVPGA